MKDNMKENAKHNPNWGMKGKKHKPPTIEKMSKKAKLRLVTFKSTSKMSRSKSEIAWGEFIKETYGIILQHSKWLQGRCFDYCYNDYLFEIDGSYWHSFKESKRIDALKNEIAKINGYTLVRFSIDTIKQAFQSVINNKEILDSIFIKSRENYVSQSM
jgi:very-short-patch-repair endonuclease